MLKILQKFLPIAKLLILELRKPYNIIIAIFYKVIILLYVYVIITIIYIRVILLQSIYFTIIIIAIAILLTSHMQLMHSHNYVCIILLCFSVPPCMQVACPGPLQNTGFQSKKWKIFIRINCNYIRS